MTVDKSFEKGDGQPDGWENIEKKGCLRLVM